MDTITHGIAGALIGKGYFSERGGKVAIFAATLGAVFPDCDVVADFLSHDPLAIVKYHRGITHSFVGLPFFAAALAWLTRRVARRLGMESPSWGMLTLIYGIGIASHILLDGLTSFGTRMWTPISQRRVAWDWLFIIDFVFTSLVLVPQIVAWVHSDRTRSRSRAAAMWAVLTVAAAGVWWLAGSTGFPFHAWILAPVSAIFATLFFLPARNDWGFQIRRAEWCRAGLYLTLAYVAACGMAHHAAYARVQKFAAQGNLRVTRMGALPLPPSLLDWAGGIRTPDGVYQSRFDLRQAGAPGFIFSSDSPPDEFTQSAMRLPEVNLYWNFARFPVIHSWVQDGYHVVDFSENRSIRRRKKSPPPFSYRVVFDDAGNVVEEGWQQDSDFMRRMQRLPRPAGAAPAPEDSP